jgi:hypothetical protein
MTVMLPTTSSLLRLHRFLPERRRGENVQLILKGATSREALYPFAVG